MELSKQEYYEKFQLCAMDKDVLALEKILGALMKERTKLDRWFDKYLEMFDRKMNVKEPNTPIWKLYNSKSSEYSELNNIILTANAYIKKLQNV
jgi:hypothetical protein